jgi:phage-related minor tail protein
VIDGKRFEDVLKGLVLRLSNLAVRMAFKPLERGFASAFEGLFAAFGNAKPFADGGVIASPTYFPLGRGGVGLAGEAGPEAILPLARGADGRLGVAAGGHAVPSQVTINIATQDAASFRHSEAYVTGLIARAVARGQRSL